MNSDKCEVKAAASETSYVRFPLEDIINITVNVGRTLDELHRLRVVEISVSLFTYGSSESLTSDKFVLCPFNLVYFIQKIRNSLFARVSNFLN